MQKAEMQKILKEIYGIEFPDSFFAFQDFLQTLNAEISGGLYEVLEFRLCEVFDIFKPDFNRQKYNPLWDSRYYNDPPEFLTVLSGHSDGLHWGLYLEDPLKPAWLVASFYSNDAYELSIDEDLFTAIRKHLEFAWQDYSDYLASDAKSADYYREKLEKINRLREILMTYATKDRSERGYDYTDNIQYKFWFNRPLTAQTRDRTGITVSPALYKQINDIDPFESWNYKPNQENVKKFERDAMDALKDGFPGTTLKMTKDLWIYHEHFETTFRLLDAAYEALNWTVLRNLLRQAKDRREDYDAARRKYDESNKP